MKIKPIIVVCGEPFSIFSELFIKLYKSKYFSKFKKPIILIGSEKLFYEQAKKFKVNLKINSINNKNYFFKKKLKKINIINVNFKFKNKFGIISKKSKKYIEDCFNIGIDIMNKGYGHILINGPISKKAFLNKKYPGVTEYISSKTKTNGKEVMLIYNEKTSVSPTTTHVPLNKVLRNLNSQKIVNQIKTIDAFYKKYLKIKPRIGVCGINTHCETNSKISEEKKIILPAFKKLKYSNIFVKGPFPADTIFTKNNRDKFNVIIGMYHDQVLSPIKALHNFNAINITLGLPFLRITPDHGPNHQMIGKNKSDPTSLKKTFDFASKFNEI